MSEPPDVICIPYLDSRIGDMVNLMDYAFHHNLEYLYERAKEQLLNSFKSLPGIVSV